SAAVNLDDKLVDTVRYKVQYLAHPLANGHRLGLSSELSDVILRDAAHSEKKPKGDQYAWSDSRVSLRISLLPHLSGRIFVCDRFRRQHRSCSKDDRFGTDGAADKSAHYQRHFAESLCSAAQRNGATMVQARLEKN